MTYAATATATYSVADIETVVRRFTADIVMIAQSSAAITEDKARQYAHDVDELAKKGYLAEVDLTLFSGGTEVRAAKYVVDTAAGDLTMSRPGSANWPRVANPDFRIVLSYTKAYTDSARVAMKGTLKINWVTSIDDTSHPTLRASGGRDYAANGWGMRRKDFTS